MSIINNKNSFTLTEIIIVVVIIGIIAGFAIPNYQRTIERTYVRDARTNLLAIHAAQQVYYSENGYYWPQLTCEIGIPLINSNLHLNIIQNGFDWDCCDNDGSGKSQNYACSATRTPSSPYFLRITEASIDALNPICSGTCP